MAFGLGLWKIKTTSDVTAAHKLIEMIVKPF